MVNDENDDESVSDRLRDLTSVGGVGRSGERGLPTNGDLHQAHWSVLELTYSRAQRFGKQEEPHARRPPGPPPRWDPTSPFRAGQTKCGGRPTTAR
jgi:hypothetical protein